MKKNYNTDEFEIKRYIFSMHESAFLWSDLIILETLFNDNIVPLKFMN